LSEYEIPKEYLKKLEIVSKKVGEPEKNLQQELVQRFTELKVEYPEKKTSSLWKLGYVALCNKWKPVGRALAWTGFFIGETDVRDWTEITKRYIDNMPPEKREQFITASGEYLNPFEKSRSYLDPLPEHRYFKFMYGIIGYPGFKDPAFAVLEWNNQLATKVPEHSFEVMYDFRATERKSEEIRRLGATKITAFKESSFTLERSSMEELIDTLSPKKEFSTLSEYYDLIGRKKALQEVIITEATVSRIAKSERGYVLTLEDPDVWTAPVTAFVPPFIPIDFGVNSIILIMGHISKNKQGDLRLNTLGIFPREEFTLKPKEEY